MDAPTWTEVALAALNVLQVIALAWIAREQLYSRIERNYRANKDRREEQ